MYMYAFYVQLHFKMLLNTTIELQILPWIGNIIYILLKFDSKAALTWTTLHTCYIFA